MQLSLLKKKKKEAWGTKLLEPSCLPAFLSILVLYVIYVEVATTWVHHKQNIYDFMVSLSLNMSLKGTSTTFLRPAYYLYLLSYIFMGKLFLLDVWFGGRFSILEKIPIRACSWTTQSSWTVQPFLSWAEPVWIPVSAIRSLSDIVPSPVLYSTLHNTTSIFVSMAPFIATEKKKKNSAKDCDYFLSW